MTTIVKRYPTFDIEFVTEDSEYILRYDTEEQLTQDDLEEAIISFSVKNAMEDDSPVFSLVLLAKEEWDKVLTSNDLVRIKAIPDVTKGEPDNPYIMVGLISDVHKEGEYADGILLYRVTGRAMAKALMDFEVGVIQEVSTVITDFGWLPDDEERGLKFTNNTAAGIGKELMDKLVYEYAKYSFSSNSGLRDYLEYQFESWDEYESLADVTAFINYEGSIRQFLEDIAAKPFNELYFDFTKEGTCAIVMRPTPFDPDKWDKLRPYEITSDSVVEESFGKSDAEMYSVFVVQAPNLAEYNAMDLGVFPQFNESLIDKYGYKRLDAENRYLLTEGLSNVLESYQPGEGEDGETIPPPLYEELLEFITDNELSDEETLRTDRNSVHTSIAEEFPGLTSDMVDMVIDSVIDEDFTRDRYNVISFTTGDEELDRQINEEREASGEKLKEFTKKLFNWYCENANFYSGDLRVLGNPMFRLGSIIRYRDFERNDVWEFYLESVQHEFSFTNGYTTILGVTRGLPKNGKDRFTNMWGTSEDFKGGYLGEASLEELLERAEETRTSGNLTEGQPWSLAGGGDVAMSALNTAREMVSRPSTYTWGGGRTGSNPFASSHIRVDCSSFVWWCYYTHGVSLSGGKTGMTTDTIKKDPKFKVISTRGSGKATASTKLLQGDLVYFDTYKADGHVGIYSGGGTFIGAQGSTGIAVANMEKGYWYDKFNGHILRYGDYTPTHNPSGPSIR